MDSIYYPLNIIKDIVSSDKLPLIDKMHDKGERPYYSITSQQKPVFIVEQMGNIGLSNNNPLILSIEGKLDISRLSKAIQTLVDRHESLRISFDMVDGIPVQIINKRIRLKKTYRKTEDDIDSIMAEHVKPFDIFKAPLFRVELLNVSPEKHFLFMDFHSLLFDGASLYILLEELLEIYNGKELKEINIKYSDFILWHESLQGSEYLKEKEEYWMNVFSDEVPVIDLLTDYSRKLGQGFAGNRYYFTLHSSMSHELRNLSHDLNIPLSTVLLASFNILLSKYVSNDDIITGFPVTGRRHGIEDLTGLFVNTIPLRNFPKEEKTFRDFALEVHENLLKSFENQDYHMDYLVEKLNLERETGRHPLFDVVFAVQESNDFSLQADGLKINIIPGKMEGVNFDLTMVTEEKGEDINLYIEYRTAIFKEETVKSMAEHFICLLKDIVKHPDSKLKNLNILPEEEYKKIFYDFNNTDMDYDKDRTVIELFQEQAEKNPDNIALVYKDKKLTFRELNKRANHLAELLRSKGIKPDDIVGILSEPSLEMIAGTMGIIKSGAAYMPVDFKYPPERVKYMLEDSRSSVILTKKHFREHLKDFSGEIIELDDTDLYTGDSSNPPVLTKPHNLAYIIYTSGSTGKPKGVMIEHGSLLNLSLWQAHSIELLPEDRATKYAGFGFDVSIAEIFATLITGASLYVISDDIRMSLKELNEYFESNSINKIFLPTQFCEHFMELVDNRSLSVVDVAGEKLKHYKKGNYRLLNKYGPTEYTVYTTCFEVDRFYDNIPIGKPVWNTKIFIVDKYNRLQPVGVAGELCISGAGLARGYLNAPSLTSEKFVENPFLPGEKMYRTGDLARYLSDGNIEYLGRMDQQVKIRGFRIELGEIKEELLKIDKIEESAVIDREDEGGNKYLCAYVVSDEKIDVEVIKELLAKELPEYMIPAYIIQLEKIAFTPNGKLDRKALPAPDAHLAGDYIAPSHDKEKKIVEVWQKVLGIKKIGINDNFFSLGGHSLKAVTSVAKLQADFEITVNDIFKYKTAGELAKHIKERKDYLRTKLQSLKENLSEKHIKKYEHIDLSQKSNYRNILLTGVTGYIGGHLLMDLLKETENTIYLIIRGSNYEEAEKRLYDKLQYYFPDDLKETYKERIHILNGDLSLDMLGLTEEIYNSLSENIDCIIHSAANVRHYGHYEDFYKNNVIVTKNILDFAKKEKKKDLHHISTISVAEGNVKGKNKVLFTEEDLDIGQTIETFYGQTKLQAEKFVISAREEGLNANIYRIGTAVFHSKTGMFQQNIEENAFYSMVKSYINLGVIPNTEEIDFTYVDCATRAIFLLHDRKNLLNETFHILNNKKINLSSVMTDAMLNIENFPSGKFIDYLYENYDNPLFKTSIENIMLHKGWLSHEGINIEILSLKTDVILSKLDFQWPVLDITKMKPLIKRALLDRINILRDIPICSELSEEDLCVFAGLAKEEYYYDESDILWEGDINRTFYIIVDGFVELMKYSKAGWLGTIRVMGPGSFFGECNIWDECPSCITAEVFMGDAHVLSFKGDDFVKLLEKYPVFSVSFINAVTDKVKKLESIMIEFG
jgi:amino acid adenylation domain-containing protein/thioester reductase-like protein